MSAVQNKGGRPALTEEQKKEIVSKVEPYLKSGLSISKAVSEAQISRATFYRLMQEDEEFRDKIQEFKNFISILANSAIIRELQQIIRKQNDGQVLNNNDRRFLQWFVLNSSHCKEEYGMRKSLNIYDPESEIQKINSIIALSTTKQIVHE